MLLFLNVCYVWRWPEKKLDEIRLKFLTRLGNCMLVHNKEKIITHSLILSSIIKRALPKKVKKYHRNPCFFSSHALCFLFSSLPSPLCLGLAPHNSISLSIRRELCYLRYYLQGPFIQVEVFSKAFTQREISSAFAP